MKKIWTTCLLTLAMLMLTACGGSGTETGATADSMAYVSAPSAAAPMETVKDAADGGSGLNFDSMTSQAALKDQKMIYTANLEMETTAFGEAVEGLQSLTADMDGYFENSSMRNHGHGYRWSEYTIRIPQERFSDFLNQASQLCHVTWSNASLENVTEYYYDTEGRLKTQQIKLERLQELLAKATEMEDIITIESAISETEWQIEELAGTLRHYDALVDYSTVYITLSEVYKLSNVEEVPEGFGSRMGSAFTNGWKNFVDDMEDMVVGLAYSWVWVLILAAGAVLVIWTIRKCRAHRRQVRAAREAAAAQTQIEKE